MNKTEKALLGIGNDISISDTIESEDKTKVYLHLKVKEKERKCTSCGSPFCNIHDSGKTRKIRHVPMFRKSTFLVVTQRRYICTSCGATFMEDLDWIYPGMNITKELFHLIAEDLKHYTSKKEIARVNCITPYFVTAVEKKLWAGTPARLPEVVCLDEVHAEVWHSDKHTGNRYKLRFVTNFSDGRTGRLLEVFPFVSKKRLVRFFKTRYPYSARCKVKFLCCDMGKAYLGIQQECFPNAIVCLDNYHIFHRLNLCVDNVRIREQNRFLAAGDEESYFLLKGLSRRLKTSVMNQERLWSVRQLKIVPRLMKAFSISPALRDAYAMLQYFHELRYNNFSFETQCTSLQKWINKFQDSHVDEIHSAVKTITEHLPFIHNAWRYRLSNATCEGNNNSIQTIKRISFGIYSFDYLRKRMLLVCGRPGVDREKSKDRLALTLSHDSFFYRAFPELEEFTHSYSF